MACGALIASATGAKLFSRIPLQGLVERRIGDVRAGITEEQRIAVGHGARHVGGRDVAVGAGAVLHHELLAERPRQTFANKPRGEIAAAAGGARHHDGHRAVRIALRLSERHVDARRHDETGDQERREPPHGISS